MAVNLECSICLNTLFEPAAVFQDEATRADEAGRPVTLGGSNGGIASSVTVTGSQVGVRNAAASVIVKMEKKSPKMTRLRSGALKRQTDLLSLSGTSGTPCGHLFHTHCLQNWFKQGKGCPTCRKQFRRTKIILMFEDACIPEAPTLMPIPMPILTPTSSTLFSQNGSDFNVTPRQPTLKATPAKRKVVVISSDENHDVFPMGAVAIKVEKDVPEANNLTVPKNDVGLAMGLKRWKDTHEKLSFECAGVKRRYMELEDEKELCRGIVASLEHSQAEQPQAKFLKYEDDEVEILAPLTPNSAQRKQQRQANENDTSRPDEKKTMMSHCSIS